MAEKIGLELDINSAGSAKTVGELRKQVKDFTNAALEAEKAGKKILSEQFFQAAAKAKDAFGDLQEKINTLNPDERAAAFAKLGTSIAGGFAAAQGAAALFNTKNEEVEKTLLKVQSATAILQGAQSLADGLKQAGIVKNIALLKLEQLAQSQNIVIAKAAAVAQRVLNAVMNANPIGIIITAIVAAAGAIALFASNTDKAKKSQEELNEELKREKEILDTREKTLTLQRTLNENRLKREIELLKAKGATDKEIYDKERQLIQESINKLRFREGFIGKLSVEELKQKLDLNNQLLVLEANFERAQKEKEDEKAKKAKEKKEAQEKKDQDELERLKEKQRKLNEDLSTEQVVFEFQQEQEKKEREAQAQINAVDRNAVFIAEKQEQDKLAAEREIELEKQKAEAKQLIAESTFTTLNDLAIGFIDSGKRLSDAQKALTLTQLGFDTASAIGSLVKHSEANPLNSLTFGGAGLAQYIAGLARILSNIAKARRLLKVDSGAGVQASASAPRATDGFNSGSQPPPLLQPSTTPSTVLNLGGKTDGSGGSIKVYVTETDIKKATNKVKGIEAKAQVF